ncbi:protein kinase PINOID 2-like isoform X2 [Durio zibethinus]|uniref:non-specific serine/threonine protein kinase n=1 Tax=Durio zibethinus TaxID=66656 RepID=A0A6P5WHF0_DURZI|nr:protein kinase PINOID 2-like isoform X2 [Durio zibethinus]
MASSGHWKIFGMLDHPFLPTLYAELDCCQYSCLVMEYFPDGDLLTLQQRRSDMRFTIPSSKSTMSALQLQKLFYSSSLFVCGRESEEREHY